MAEGFGEKVRKLLRENPPKKATREELKTEIFDTLRNKIPNFDKVSGTTRLVNKRANSWFTVSLKKVDGGKKVVLERQAPLEPGASYTTRVVFHPDNSMEFSNKYSFGYVDVKEVGWAEMANEEAERSSLNSIALELKAAVPQDEPKKDLRIRAPGLSHLADTIAKRGEKK